MLNLRWLLAARFHGYPARQRRGLAGHMTNAIDFTIGQALMKPSHDAWDRVQGSEGYHSRADLERGFDRGRGRASHAP